MSVVSREDGQRWRRLEVRTPVAVLCALPYITRIMVVFAGPSRIRGEVTVGAFECARGQRSTRRLVSKGYDQQRAGDRRSHQWTQQLLRILP